MRIYVLICTYGDIDLDSLARISYLERDFIGRIGKPRSQIFKEVGELNEEINMEKNPVG